MSETGARSRRGAPLMMLAGLLGVWIAGRTAIWESPFNDAIAKPVAANTTSAEPAPAITAIGSKAEWTTQSGSGFKTALSNQQRNPRDWRAESWSTGRGPDLVRGTAPSEGQSRHDPPPARPGQSNASRITAPANPPFVPPVLPPTPQSDQRRPDRWALDAWAFIREGSRAAPIAQTRTPIYGASQAGAKLLYRFAPRSAHDPRAFARAYTALVPNGESELALGVSARPIGRVPVRVVAELRGTDDLAGTELRPAALAFSELAPVALPADLTLEAYGSAGYVGGRVNTAFADGQLTAMRELTQFENDVVQNARVSVGAGAWGGAQRGASRVDVGPAVRLDARIGRVPARVSLDYRLRVAGDAAPGSGLAATLSTRF